MRAGPQIAMLSLLLAGCASVAAVECTPPIDHHAWDAIYVVEATSVSAPEADVPHPHIPLNARVAFEASLDRILKGSSDQLPQRFEYTQFLGVTNCAGQYDQPPVVGERLVVYRDLGGPGEDPSTLTLRLDDALRRDPALARQF